MAQENNRNSLLFSALVLCAVNVLNFYDRHVPGALTEPIRKEFHLTDTQIGLLGSAFIWIYALIGLPLGRIADSASRKKLLAAAVLIWSSLTASAAFAHSFTMLLFSRVGVGVGEAGCAPAATSWLGDLFPPDKRSRVLALFMLGVPVGGALSFFFSGSLAQAYGWRVAMILAAAPALLLVPALLFLPEPKRGASEARPEPLAPGSMWTILRIPTLWWIIASGALLNFSLYAVATFLPAFLSRIHGLSLASSGIAAGIVYIIGGLVGCVLAGYLGDAAIRRRVYSAIQDLVAPNQRGATMAIYFMAMYACGASFGPLLTGRLSDFLAHRAAQLAGSATVTEAFRAIGLQQAMLIIPVLSVVLAGVLYAGSRTIVTDIAARQPVASIVAAD